MNNDEIRAEWELNRKRHESRLLGGFATAISLGIACLIYLWWNA